MRERTADLSYVGTETFAAREGRAAAVRSVMRGSVVRGERGGWTWRWASPVAEPVEAPGREGAGGPGPSTGSGTCVARASGLRDLALREPGG
ncbi:hypothetical protein CHE218_26730 [Microbacterium sp. che218]